MARLLFIDDNELLRSVAAEALRLEGHDVVQAADGRAGVELARVSTFDVVITDLIMPVQEGVETITILHKEQPRLPIIAISGGAAHSALYLNIARKIGAARILAKPFTPTQLLGAIDEVLRAPPPPTPPAGA